MTSSSAFPDWTGLEENAWDQCLINGEAVPGVVTITTDYGGGLKAEKGQGLNGAFIRDTGIEATTFTMTILLANADDARQWAELAPKIFPARSAQPRKPVTIVHPALYTFNISQVMIDKVTTGAPSAQKGMLLTFKLFEFLKPRPVIKRVIPTNPDKGSPSGFITDPRGSSPATTGPYIYR